MTRQQFAALLNLEEHFIPAGRRNRPGTANNPKFITIHNTDNANSGADARAHGKFLIKTGHYMLNGKQHWVSWHYSVDDKRIVKHLPLNEKAFHAASANGQSVAIEICMHQGIDQQRAFLNAARLTALLLFDLRALNSDINKVVPHHFWTGKNCPRLLLNNGKIGNKWNEFLQLILRELDTIDQTNATIASEIETDLIMNSDDPTGLESPIDIEVSTQFHLEEDEDSEEDSVSYVPLKTSLYLTLTLEAQKKEMDVETLISTWLKEKRQVN